MGCGFSRVLSDATGISDFSPPLPTRPLRKQCPFDNNLLSACLTSTQLSFLSQQDSAIICGTKHHFLEPWPHWGDKQLSCSRDSSFPPSLTPSPTSSWCYTGISCPFIRSLLQECSLYLILSTWLRYVTWWGVGGYWEIGPIKLEEPERDYPVHLYGYIDEEIKTPGE